MPYVGILLVKSGVLLASFVRRSVIFAFTSCYVIAFVQGDSSVGTNIFVAFQRNFFNPNSAILLSFFLVLHRCVLLRPSPLRQRNVKMAVVALPGGDPPQPFIL
jgi:hypothetical protein